MTNGGPQRFTLIVEGSGDVYAMPSFWRGLLHFFERYDFVISPQPIRAGEIKRLRKAGELERFTEMALLREDTTAVILILDIDDECPVQTAIEFRERVKPLVKRYGIKFGIAFLKKNTK